MKYFFYLFNRKQDLLNILFYFFLFFFFIQINWVQYINDRLRVVNITIDSSEEVVVYAPEYLEKLTGLVHSMLNDTNGRRYRDSVFLFCLLFYLMFCFKKIETIFNNSQCYTVLLSISFCRILNNYMIWPVVRSFSNFLSKPFRDARNILAKSLLGRTLNIP